MTKENWIILLCVGLILMIAAMPSGQVAGSWKRMIGGSAEGISTSREKPPGESMELWDGDQQTVSESEGSQLSNGTAAHQGIYGAGAGSQGDGSFGNGEDLETGAILSRGNQTSSDHSYEAILENRVKEVLAKVEGVGQVDVLIVLKSSEQKVYQTDGRTSQSTTKEQDSSGGTRDITEFEEESSTVLAGYGSTAGSSITGGSISSGSSSGPLLEKEIRPEISGIVISAQGGGIPTVKSEITDAMVALFDLPAHKIKVLKRVE